MRRAIPLLMVLTAGCQFQAPSNPDEQPLFPGVTLTKEEDRAFRCIQKYRRVSSCVELSAPQRMRGVWYTGFEESGFVANVDRVSLTRKAGWRVEDIGPEFYTELELDPKPIMRRLGLPEQDRCIRAVAIKFIGRRDLNPMTYPDGKKAEFITVNRVIDATYLGRVRSLGLPGYDKQCATPAPSKAEVEAMDRAEWNACVEQGSCIPAAKPEQRRKN